MGRHLVDADVARGDDRDHRLAVGIGHGHEAVGHRGERHAVDLAAEAIAIEHDLAERQRAGAGRRHAVGGGHKQVGERGLGERHRHGVRTRQPQQRQHVGQRPAGAALVLGDGDHRQAHLLDRLPEIDGPYALLDTVHDVLAAPLGKEAVGGFQQHLARFAVHKNLHPIGPSPVCGGRCRRPTPTGGGEPQ